VASRAAAPNLSINVDDRDLPGRLDRFDRFDRVVVLCSPRNGTS
jgi:hypothetical protein